MPRIEALYRYPVKGFSAEPLERAEIEAGGTMPFDRAFAVENGPSGFDPAAPGFLPKIRFLMLMKHEGIAAYRTAYDEDTGLFSVERDGEILIRASLHTDEGRAAIEAWIAETFAAELRGAPRILFRPGHSFSDSGANLLHVVNRASVRALEEKLGRRVDPLRFRPNLVVDGAEPFAELDWVGRRLVLPGIVLRGEHRTERCAATNVEPGTGARDMRIPRALLGLYGHSDFGIYCAAATGGTLSVGDAIEPEDRAAATV